MAHLDTLPTDSVLRRHADTERKRILGLPPTDSVLRRHHEQLQAALRASAVVQPVRTAAAVAKSSPAPTVAAPKPVLAAPVSAPAPSTASAKAEGGLFGWLRRLLGAS
jgi:hypothetical protein